MSGLGSTGWVPKTVDELRQEAEETIRTALGDDVDVSAESVFGPLIAALATKLGELWELVGSVYNARVPAGASGAALEALCELAPGIERRAATKGTVTLSVTLNAGVTLPTGSRASVSGEPSNAWVTTEDVTNSTGSPATVSVAAEALDAGRTPANAGTITAIATPVTGWTAVTNAADATPGLEIETDAELRLRREQRLQRAGSSPLESIEAEVSEVSGVTQCVAWENASIYVDALGRAPKSVDVLVVGGDDEDIARALWAAKAGGIETIGNVVVDFVDARGVTRRVFFSRPTTLAMYATVRVEIDPDTYAGDAAVEDALLEVTEGLHAGAPVRISDIVTAVCAVSGVIDAYVFVGAVETESLQQRTNYLPGERERCVFDSARITVVRGLS